MKARISLIIAAAFISVAASAQIGHPFIHDPSTIAECDGKYYTFGTGGGGLISEDGWTWESGAVRPGGGAAPDVIKIGDRYLVGYSATGGGLGGGHAGRILVMWNKTLDPNSPDFAYSDPIEVAHSEMDEDCDAIDVGLFLDPTTGRLWAVYGTYFGAIRIVELDPKTGERVKGNIEKDVAIDCEATDLIYHNGWYYLLGTHGTCCDGVNSTYNIVCGRSRSVTGPFLDNMGRDMLAGGGKMVISAENRRIGAGHFGRTIVTEGVEKMSLHWEADMDMSGRSTLAIRPIVWVDDWPVSGGPWKDGTFAIISQRRGYALELAVDFVRLAGAMRGFSRGGGNDEPMVAVADQKLEDVIGDWPKGEIPARISDIMWRPHQKWIIEEVKDAPGYLGGLYCKIIIAGTNRALAATADKDVTTVPEFTGAPEQLWRIDMLTDGTYRIMPKAVPGTDEEYVLVSTSDSTPSMGKFNFASDNCKWQLKQW